MAKVSVIIPCFNQGRYLEEAVSSVLGQTFGDYEIIVVNDGSTDPFTNALLDEYSPPRTRILHTENQGLSSARNTGITAAAGEYILPLDADDKIGSEYIEQAVRVMDEQANMGIVYCEAAYFGGQTGFWELPKFEMSRMLVSNLIFCSAMFRKSDWERVGGYNPNMIYGWEDWDLWLSILELGRKVHRIPRLLFYYRTNETSMISAMSEGRQALMRLQIGHNHPKLFENLIQMDFTPKAAQIFVDTGNGFNETESVSLMITEGSQILEFDIHMHHPVKALRFDPANAATVFTISKMTVVERGNRELNLAGGHHNALYQQGPLYLFDVEDPWIEMTPPAEELDKILLDVEYIAFGSSIYKHLLDHRHRAITEQADQIKSLRTQIGEQDQLLREKNTIIETKENRIIALTSELNWIKSLFIWRIINLYRLMGKPISIFKKEGSGVMLEKIRNYLGARKSRIKAANSRRNYQIWMERNQLTKTRTSEIQDELKAAKYQPKISIVMPVYNVERCWLEKAIDSVRAQLYPNWELCIADDASSKGHIQEVLNNYAKSDPRVRIKRLAEGRGISGASNAALSMATGEFVGLLDHDDELSADALFENIKLLNRRPDADLIYSDEDKLDSRNNRVEPFFKPDWSPDYFRSLNYISHFTLIRKSLVNRIGRFRSGFEGAQDYDLILRVTEKTQSIHHIPKVLYHWRKIPGSTAASLDNKMDASLSGQKALAQHLENIGTPASVSIERPTNYRVHYHLDQRGGNTANEMAPEEEGGVTPMVSIVIPFKDKVSLLKTCVTSILKKTTYDRYEIILVSNNSEERDTFRFVEEMLQTDEHVSFLEINEPFNFSRLNNRAVRDANGSYLLFLNNDTEIWTNTWLEIMLGYAQLAHAGAVGAKLVFPDGRIQHAGITLGVMGAAWNSFWKAKRDHLGHFHNLVLTRNCAAVSAACMLVAKDKFLEVGGFNENLAIGFNDVDLCLKLMDAGLFNIFVPYVELLHDESASRGSDDKDCRQLERNRSENEYLYRVWGKYIQNDPFYNPNLSRDTPFFDIGL